MTDPSEPASTATTPPSTNAIHVEAPFTLDTWDATADPAPELQGAPEMGRAVLARTYTGGDLEGSATGHALTTRGPGGASYVAQERIVGILRGRDGSFVLEHAAVGGEDVETVLRAAVVPGSGTGGLTGLSGTGRVEHGLLTLDVELPAG